MQAAVRREIKLLEKKSTRMLKAQYEELFQEETRSNNRAYLMRRIGWRIQANAEGELSERARQRAVEIADDANLRLRPPRRFYGDIASTAPDEDRDRRLPHAGSLLRRNFRGREFTVKVLANGFEFAGMDSRSRLKAQLWERSRYAAYVVPSTRGNPPKKG